MKNNFISTINKVLLSLVALLGFSCSTDDPKVEYGMPSANFKASGTILNVITLQKLSNIEIVMDSDTVYSDENGNYEILVNSFPDPQIYTISFKDIDGAANGSYLPTDTIVDFSDVQFQNGDGSWYSGEKAKEINIKLSPDETI